MDGVQPERLPEIAPVSSQPERLDHFVETVGEVIEAIETQRGRDEKDRGEKDAALPVERAAVR